MKKYVEFSNGVKVLGAAVLCIVLSVAVFIPVKADTHISGNITEADLTGAGPFVLDADVVLTINNNTAIDSNIELNGHNLTINGPVNGTKTLTVNGRISPGHLNTGGDLTINNGVKIVVSSAEDGHTVYVDDLIVNGGSLDATCNYPQAGTDRTAAIHARSSITVNSGELKGNSGGTGISSGTISVRGGTVTAQGGTQSGLFGSSGIVISGDNTIVNAQSGTYHAIATNTGGVSISGGTVTANGGGTNPGIFGKPTISITGGRTVVNTNLLKADDDISIAGEKTVVKATNLSGLAAIQSRNGTIRIAPPLKIIKPAGGRIDGGEIRKSDDTTADDIEIRKPGGGGGGTVGGTAYKTDTDDEKSDDEESDEAESQDESKPAVVNYDAIHVLSITGFPYGTFFAKQDQGLAAKHAFTLALPKGYQEAFTFNMITNGHKGDYSLKKGKFTIEIPEKYRRAGRIFALQVIDRSGKVLLLPDKDDNPYTISVDVNVEGYAFDLIYSD